MRLAVILAPLLLALAVLPAASAERRDTGVFDLEIRGFRAGVLTLSGAQNEAAYAATARLQSAGLVGLIRSLRFDATARGRVEGDRLVPQTYSEDMDNGRRATQTELEFTNGVPRVVRRDPPREPRAHDVDPATQGGTLDPMTAIYALLRDVPAEDACRLNLQLFDGSRRTEVRLTAPQVDGQAITCAGEMRRVAGYTPSEMAEATRFPFTLVYGPAPEPGRVRVTRLTAESLYGRARLVRR